MENGQAIPDTSGECATLFPVRLIRNYHRPLMRFRKLKLVGFKSFVEPTDMPIEPGLTGIVGPNGCGKSNLLEAVRWAMGENSFKSMRASAMDDVIFNGSRTRPPRNMAEVTLTLDNSRHLAPPPWRSFDSIEVSRRIVREKGSTYRINGREVRARDVQLLFADVGTGARSPALVRQGRISELINAKPQARRRLLEEAAGIAGLYARRHEAELKLNAAEQNLSRLDDVLAQLEQQVRSLSRQARQAARYRDLSDTIRAHEAALLWRAWREAAQAHLEAEQALAEAERAQAEAVYEASLKQKELELAREKIAPLREEAAEKGAAAQRLKLELEGLARQEKAAQARRRELEERLRQAQADIERLAEDAKDAAAALQRLAEEEAALAAEKPDAARRAELEAAWKEKAEALRAAQQALDDLRAQLAERAAEKGALESRIAELRRRRERLLAEREALTAKLAAARAQVDEAAISAQEAALAEAGQRLAAAEKALAEAEQARIRRQEEERAAREALDAARTALHEKQRAVDALRAEMAAIERMLGAPASEAGARLVDALEVDAGYEKALAAALGDDLEAALDEEAAAHWRALEAIDLPPLPEETTPLADHVRAPAALARRLSSIGVVENAFTGHLLQPALQPGQRLVSREGDLWRWDGFVAAAEAPTAAARRLEARNRLADLRAQLDAAQAALDEARQARQTAEAALQEKRAAVRAAEAAEREARDVVKRARKAMDEARRALERQRAAQEEMLRALAGLEATGERLNADIAAVERDLAEAEKALADLPGTEELEAALAQQRAVVEVAQEQERSARLALERLEQAARAHEQRLARLARERADWQRRAERARAHMEEVTARRERLAAQLAELEAAPDAFSEKRDQLHALLRKAEKAAAAAADVLAEAERGVLEQERAWRAAEEALSEARAAFAGAQARRQAAAERLEEVLLRVRERAQCRPEHLLAKTPWGEDDCPEKAELERALARAREARERLGAVNLRAEVELEEARAELEKLIAERDDVQKAVDKLRGAIASLNREGRKRLLEAFDKVNEHFAALFATLFGGGKAHLELIESDDPLDAGLEIFAQPPGKRLQTLSLLSGGEQTLTALALIFAVFLVNPSPICVLDEVDAPLDEHNVERFCNLLDDMLKRAPTDFLVITHHPLTMARMHRLFGVTMMEPGVSRLVSVDLETAEKLREAS